MADRNTDVMLLQTPLPGGEALSVAGALRGTVALATGHGGIAVLGVGLQAAAFMLLLWPVLSGPAPDTGAGAGLIVRWAASLAAAGLLHGFVLAAACASLAGRTVSLARAGGETARAALPLLAASALLAGLCVVVPTLLIAFGARAGLPLPLAGLIGGAAGLVLLAMVLPALAAVLEEGQSAFASVARAAMLTRGRRIQLALILLAALAAYLLIAVPASLLLAVGVSKAGLSDPWIAIAMLARQGVLNGVVLTALAGLEAVVYRSLAGPAPDGPANSC